MSIAKEDEFLYGESAINLTAAHMSRTRMVKKKKCYCGKESMCFPLCEATNKAAMTLIKESQKKANKKGDWEKEKKERGYAHRIFLRLIAKNNDKFIVEKPIDPVNPKIHNIKDDHINFRFLCDYDGVHWGFLLVSGAPSTLVRYTDIEKLEMYFFQKNTKEHISHSYELDEKDIEMAPFPLPLQWQRAKGKNVSLVVNKQHTFILRNRGYADRLFCDLIKNVDQKSLIMTPSDIKSSEVRTISNSRVQLTITCDQSDVYWGRVKVFSTPEIWIMYTKDREMSFYLSTKDNKQYTAHAYNLNINHIKDLPEILPPRMGEASIFN